ncbi:MAG: O-antigen ligase family protein [Parcubacteria group bacterium]|nr:O-antigen ligase family protein [Parcubacteria group bacterium]
MKIIFNNFYSQSLFRALSALIIAILFMPLVFFLGARNDLLFPKAIYFEILVEVALAVFISLILIDRRFFPKASHLTVTLFIFFIFLTLSAIFGVDPYRSFFGDIFRMEGLITLYHFFIFFLIVSSLFKVKPDFIWTLLKISFGVGILAGLSAIIELMRRKVEISSFRGGGLIGNPAVLSSYLIFIIFFGGILAFKSRNIAARYFFVVGSLFLTAILFLTQTRGAFVGFISGIIATLFFIFLFEPRKKFGLIAGGILIVFFLVGFLIFINPDSLFVQKIPLINRLTKINREDPTTKTRLLSIKTSWNAIKERPILGFGQEHYDFAYFRHFNLGFTSISEYFNFDRSHNKLLDIAVMNGVPALIIYLTLFFFIFKIIFSERFKKEESPVTRSFFSDYPLLILFKIYFFLTLWLFI